MMGLSGTVASSTFPSLDRIQSGFSAGEKPADHLEAFLSEIIVFKGYIKESGIDGRPVGYGNFPVGTGFLNRLGLPGFKTKT